MVKYGPVGGRGDPVHKTETQATTLIAAYGSAARPLRWRRRRVHPLPPLPVPYRELWSLENMSLKVIPESTRKEVTQIQRTWVLVIESKNSQRKICVFEVENCFATGVRRYWALKGAFSKITASKKHAAGKEKLKVTKRRGHVCTCVFAMLKTVKLEGGLYECSLKSKLIELSYWWSLFSLKSV